jgi:hypothetical protein
VDEALLLRFTAELGGQLADPLKTTVVQNQRCMSSPATPASGGSPSSSPGARRRGA